MTLLTEKAQSLYDAWLEDGGEQTIADYIAYQLVKNSPHRMELYAFRPEACYKRWCQIKHLDLNPPKTGKAFSWQAKNEGLWIWDYPGRDPLTSYKNITVDFSHDPIT